MLQISHLQRLGISLCCQASSIQTYVRAAAMPDNCNAHYIIIIIIIIMLYFRPIWPIGKHVYTIVH